MTIHVCDWCGQEVNGKWVKIKTEVCSTSKVSLWKGGPKLETDDPKSLIFYDNKDYDLCQPCFEKLMGERFYK